MSAVLNILRSRRYALSGADGGSERPIVLLISVLLLFESAMYSAVTPVLPHYAHALHASKPAVGLLAAAYPAGIIPGSLLGAWIASRAGVRRTTLIGLLLFAVSIVAFGFGTQIGTLDALRFVQGAGCGFIWGGGLTWVIAVAPRESRGAVLGKVFAAAIFGTLLGPILGTLAVTVGTRPVFSAVGAVSFGLAAWTTRHPEPPAWQSDEGWMASLRKVRNSPRILLGSWLILLEAGTLGATGTLLPLRLSRLGGSGILIGATFLVASLLSTRIATPVGRLVDRRGPALPLCLGLSSTAVLLATLPLPASAVGLAIISVIVLGGPLTAYTIPAMAIITDTAERIGLPLVVATMMLNLAWAVGETVGAPVAASLSQATSDAVPLLLLAAIIALTLIPVIRARLTPASANDPKLPAEPAAADLPATQEWSAEQVPAASR